MDDKHTQPHGRVAAACPNESTWALLELAGLNLVFPVADTLERALGGRPRRISDRGLPR